MHVRSRSAAGTPRLGPLTAERAEAEVPGEFERNARPRVSIILTMDMAAPMTMGEATPPRVVSVRDIDSLAEIVTMQTVKSLTVPDAAPSLGRLRICPQRTSHGKPMGPRFGTFSRSWEDRSHRTAPAAGTYEVKLTAVNARGIASRELRIIAGETLALTPPPAWIYLPMPLNPQSSTAIRAGRSRGLVRP